MHLPMAVPSTVETHTEKSLRSMGSVMSGAVITTQYSTVDPSITVRFIGGSIPIVTPVPIGKKCSHSMYMAPKF